MTLRKTNTLMSWHGVVRTCADQHSVRNKGLLLSLLGLQL